MRAKLINDKRGGTQLLSVKPGWREHVLNEELEWVETVSNRRFAQVSHDSRGSVITSLYYRCTGMHLLNDMLFNEQNEKLVLITLLSCADAIATCILEGVDAGLLYFDASWVFVAQDGYPRFSYVPINRNARRGSNANVPDGHLVKLLAQLANPHNKCWNQHTEAQRRIVLGISRWSLSELTLRAFASVLEKDLGCALTPATIEAIKVLNNRDADYVSSSSYQMQAQEQNVQGTWRGVSARESIDAFRREGGVISDQERLGAFFGSAKSMGGFHVLEPPIMTNHASAQISDLSTQVQNRTECYLVIRQSDGSKYQFIDGQSVRLGRGSKNEMQLLGNPKISRHHATIECQAGRLCVCDLGSSNGTWMNGQRLEPRSRVPISIGQHFALADEDFLVRRATFL